MNSDHNFHSIFTTDELRILEAGAKLRGLSPREALRSILAEWDILRRLGLLAGERPLGVRWQLMLYCAELPEPVAEVLLQHLREPRPGWTSAPEAEIDVIRRALGQDEPPASPLEG